MDRQWICIRGRKLLSTEFIHILDSYRCSSALSIRGDQVCKQYNAIICVLQELASDYMEGKNYIGDQLSDFFERCHMELPSERKLPEALEELFGQMESKLKIDLTEILDWCVLCTNEAYVHMQKAQQKEEQRILLIKSLMEENKLNENNDKKPENQIRKLLLLQKAKIKSGQYKMDKNEIDITRVWCDLLVSSVFSEVISYGLMLRLVENEILTEFEITKLLKDKYNIEKDYEWYSEDFIGCGLDESTDIRIEDVLHICIGRIEKIIGTKI